MKSNILDIYIKTAASPQNAVDIFKDQWSSAIPNFQSGKISLFDDGRITWTEQQIGSFKGLRVLELGPLEAGHTTMIEKMGASSIVGVESNTSAYLKCLVVKEVLGLKNAHFLLGDFVPYLQQCNDRFDICIASGVLYHMVEPAELLFLLSKITDKLMIWTHYYDVDVEKGKGKKPIKPVPNDYKGFKHNLYKQEYGKGLNWKGFCGGTRPYANWMEQGDILTYLKELGFKDIRIGEDAKDHPHGPAMTLIALK